MGNIRGTNMAMIACCMAIFVSFTIFLANAADPSLLQDFCVGTDNPHSSVFVNGMVCKNPKDVKSEDFVFRGFDRRAETDKRIGSMAVQTNITRFHGLNTLGLAMARVDYDIGGVNPPHVHPRASEMLTVIEGTLLSGFVTSNLQTGANKLYTKILKKGDIFVLPQSLIHFQLNIGGTPAVANVAFGSQNPGFVAVATAVFGSTPLIPVQVLTKSFQVDEKIIESLRAQFSSEDQSHSYAM